MARRSWDQLCIKKSYRKITNKLNNWLKLPLVCLCPVQSYCLLFILSLPPPCLTSPVVTELHVKECGPHMGWSGMKSLSLFSLPNEKQTYQPTLSLHVCEFVTNFSLFCQDTSPMWERFLLEFLLSVRETDKCMFCSVEKGGLSCFIQGT